MQQSEPPHSQPVVHVRGDSETELDLLFSVLNNNDSKSPGQTYRDKNLPLSFFQPPEKKVGSGSHSREGSHDLSVYASGPTGVYHSRSHSSPAQLPLSMSLAPVTPAAHHMKQGSVNVIGDNSSSQQQQQQQQQLQQQQQPPTINWLNQNTASKFLINTNNGWQNPEQGHTLNLNNQNAMQSQNAALLGQAAILGQGGQGQHNLADLGPLPPGWEQGVTPDGDVYFIDHINKMTSWNDPRIKTNSAKKPGNTKARQALQPQKQLPQQLPQQQQQQQQQQQLAQQQQQQQLPRQPTQLPPKASQPGSFARQKQPSQLMQLVSAGAKVSAAPQTGVVGQQQSQQSPARMMNATEQMIRFELEKLKKKKVPTATLR